MLMNMLTIIKVEAEICTGNTSVHHLLFLKVILHVAQLAKVKAAVPIEVVLCKHGLYLCLGIAASGEIQKTHLIVVVEVDGILRTVCEYQRLLQSDSLPRGQVKNPFFSRIYPACYCNVMQDPD